MNRNVKLQSFLTVAEQKRCILTFLLENLCNFTFDRANVVERQTELRKERPLGSWVGKLELCILNFLCWFVFISERFSHSDNRYVR